MEEELELTTAEDIQNLIFRAMYLAKRARGEKI